MDPKRKKKIVIIAMLVALIAILAIPIINLGSLPKGGNLAQLQPDNKLFVKASTIMEHKCGHCHVPGEDLPFYASLPGAGSMVRKDVETALRYLAMPDALALEGGVPSEAVLAKIEFVQDQKTMPPMRYLSMHWNAALSGEEKNEILAWIKAARVKHFASAGLAQNLQEAMIRPLPETHSEKPEKVALGDMLYNDTRLSGDNTLSCASCHELGKGGTDQAPVATGVGGAQGPINSPTVYNAVFAVKQFWDGRAEDLKAQAAGPVTNPGEMAATWDQVVQRLQSDAALKTAFEKEYPEGFSQDSITDAIAVFEKTLITPNSPFDQYLKGDDAALSAVEKAGYQHFQSMGCATCHCGRAMGGASFETMGRKGDYFADRGKITEVDAGRFNATKTENDRGKFKTPTLRNIAQTFPYFHDASAKDLASAVQTMAKYQVGENLSQDDTATLVAFLETLTGDYKGKRLE